MNVELVTQLKNRLAELDVPPSQVIGCISEDMLLRFFNNELVLLIDSKNKKYCHMRFIKGHFTPEHYECSNSTN